MMEQAYITLNLPPSTVVQKTLKNLNDVESGQNFFLIEQL